LLVIDYHCIALLFFRVKYVGGSGDQYAFMERFERLRKRKHGGRFTARSHKTYQFRHAQVYFKSIGYIHSGNSQRYG
jgi:hypothetical protein